MENRTGEPTYDSLSQAVRDTITIFLDLIGTYSIVEVHYSGSIEDTAGLAKYAAENRLDQVITASLVKGAKKGYVISLFLFDAGKGKITFTKKATADTVLDLFDVADSTAVAFLEELSDVHLAFGSLELRCRDGRNDWSLFLNGKKILNYERFQKKVLNGKYIVSIRQNRIKGETEIFRKEIEVFEDKKTVVEFSIPPATPEELAYLQKNIDTVRKTAAETGTVLSEEAVDAHYKAVSEFTAATLNSDFDPSVRKARDAVIREAAGTVSAGFEALVKQTDNGMNGKDPDFTGLHESYERLKRIVSEPLTITHISGGADFTFPYNVTMTGNGTLYILSGHTEDRISACTKDGRLIGTIVAMEKPGHPMHGTLYAVDDSQLFYFHPENPYITGYNEHLAETERIKIPTLDASYDASSHLSVTQDLTFFLWNRSGVRIFGHNGKTDSGLEEKFRTLLEQNPGIEIISAFFDRNDILHLFGRTIDTDTGRPVVHLRLTASGTLLSKTSFAVRSPDDVIAAASVDSQGAVYFLVPNRHTVEKFSSVGEPIRSYGSYGSSEGQFLNPVFMRATELPGFYVADPNLNRITMFTPEAGAVSIPSIAHFENILDSRIAFARMAQDRISAAGKHIRPNMPLLFSLGGAVLTAGAGGLIYFASSLEYRVDDLYLQYSAETDWKKVGEIRVEIEQLWFESRLLSLGAVACLGAGIALFTEAILVSANNKDAIPDTLRSIQSRNPEYEYETDATDFRSLNTARTIGMATSILPPVLSAAALSTLYLFGVDSPELYTGILAAGIGIPAGFTHLYGGQFKASLFLSSLCADLFAAGGIYLLMTRAETFVPEDLDWWTDTAFYDNVNGIYRFFQKYSPLMLVSAAHCIRIIAGIKDALGGMTAVKNHNLYDAVTMQENRISFRIEPVFNPVGGPGIVMAVSF